MHTWLNLPFPEDPDASYPLASSERWRPVLLLLLPPLLAPTMMWPAGGGLDNMFLLFVLLFLTLPW